MISKIIGRLSINKVILIYKFLGLGFKFHNGQGSLFIEL